MCSKRVMPRRLPAEIATQGLCGRRSALKTLACLAAGLAGNRQPRPARADDDPGRSGVHLDLVDHDGLMAAVAAHRGRVVVLDCWSTSCPPCIREFPGLVALAAAHPDDVACLSLALDYDGVGTAEELLPRVRQFLEQVGAHDVRNMLACDEADTMCRRLDLASVPAVFIWKADGTLAARYDDDFAARALGRPFTYADVEDTVRDLLAPQP
jgi:thiol-disulfide isomerase/thioredoxin